MSFRYYTRVLPANAGFSTRADQGPMIEQSTLDAEVAATTGQPAALCATIGAAYIRAILDGIKANKRYPDLFGLLRALPTSGGSSPQPDGFHNAEDIKLNAAFSLLRDGLNTLRDGTGIQSLGQDEPDVPKFETMINMGNGHQNTYSIGQLVRIVGEDLKFDKADTAQGVFVAAPPNGTWVRASAYGNVTDGEVQFIVPSQVSGTQMVCVRKKVGVNIRHATYTINLTEE